MALRPLYSTQFLSWAVETSPPAYTVPAGFVAVVRDVDVSSGGGEIINWVWGIDGEAKLGGGQFTIEALNQFQEWRGRQIIPAGHFIYVQSDGPTDGQVSGYLLSL
jgi:hypothetical protein